MILFSKTFTCYHLKVFSGKKCILQSSVRLTSNQDVILLLNRSISLGYKLLFDNQFLSSDKSLPTCPDVVVALMSKEVEL